MFDALVARMSEAISGETGPACRFAHAGYDCGVHVVRCRLPLLRILSGARVGTGAAGVVIAGVTDLLSCRGTANNSAGMIMWSRFHPPLGGSSRFVGSGDRVIPPAELTFMAKRAGARITDVDAGHLSLISEASLVTSVILEAVQATA